MIFMTQLGITFQEVSKQYEVENFKLLSQIQVLEKEISCLSSCSLAREKESIRKDLERTKGKLKDAESKLKNAIQEKTKLEVFHNLPWVFATHLIALVCKMNIFFWVG